MIQSSNIYNLINKQFLNKNKILFGNLNWLNHPHESGRNTGDHFCSVIYKSKLDLIGGFDKRFAYGYHFNDDEFLLTVKYNLKLNIKIVLLFINIIGGNESLNCELANNNSSIKKWLVNKKLLEKIKKIHERNEFIYPKLLFLYWDGSPLSYLNYLTIVSFNYYNPCWKIIIFMPFKKNVKIYRS